MGAILIDTSESAGAAFSHTVVVASDGNGTGGETGSALHTDGRRMMEVTAQTNPAEGFLRIYLRRP